MRRFIYPTMAAARARARELTAPGVERVYGRRVRDRARLAPERELLVRPVLVGDGERIALIVPEGRAAQELRAAGGYDREEEERGREP